VSRRRQALENQVMVTKKDDISMAKASRENSATRETSYDKGEDVKSRYRPRREASGGGQVPPRLCNNAHRPLLPGRLRLRMQDGSNRLVKDVLQSLLRQS